MANKFQDPSSDKVQKWLDNATDKDGCFGGRLDHICRRAGHFVATDGVRLHTVAMWETAGTLYQSGTFISDNLPLDECPICAQLLIDKRYLTADNIADVCNFKREGNTAVYVSRKEFSGALRKVANVNAKKSRVEIVISKDGVTIGGQNLENARAIGGAELSMEFSARYLYQAISGMSDEIELKFRYDFEPLQITDGQLMAVVMPVHTSRSR